MDIPNGSQQPETVVPLQAFKDEIKQAESSPAGKMPTPKKTWSEADKLRLSRLLKAAEVDLSVELRPAPVCLYIEQEGEKKPLFSLGDLSLITGQAKSKKTFFTSLILSGFLGNESSGFVGFLPPDKQKVLFIDTEQKAYDVLKVAKRISALAGKDVSDRLTVLKFRGTSPLDLLELVEYGLFNIDGIGFVIIDGIKDLTTSINDEIQANDIATKLLNWTEALDIHILTVLHQNKGNSFARGHLGTELQNKAETVLSVRRSDLIDNLSEVTPVQCRMIEPRPFAFCIDEDGLPHLEDMPAPARKAKGKKTPFDFEMEQHQKVLKRVFAAQSEYKYSELITAIKLEFEQHGESFGDNKIKSFITFYKRENLISQEKGANRYPLYIHNPLAV